MNRCTTAKPHTHIVEEVLFKFNHLKYPRERVDREKLKPHNRIENFYYRFGFI